MNAVGIDVSKGKSTVAILRPQGIVVASPYDVPHTGSSLKELAMVIKKLHGETRVVMEATGNYYEPIARFLHEQGIFVSVVNPMLISDFGGNTLRKPKTDKKDAVKLALYTLTYWLDLKRYEPQEDTRKSLKMLTLLILVMTVKIEIQVRKYPSPIQSQRKDPHRCDGHCLQLW